MISRLLLSLILLCGTGLAFELVDNEIFQEPSSSADSQLSLLSKIVKNFPHADVDSGIAKWRLEHFHVLMLISRSGIDGILYLLPIREGKNNTPQEFEEIANRLCQTLKRNGQETSISIDEKGTYAQIIFNSQFRDEKGILSYNSTKSIHVPTLYLNQKLGPPFAWMNNRPVWRYIYNNERSGLLIALDLSEAQTNCIDLKRMGTKVDDKVIVDELNELFNSQIKTSRNFADIRPWRDYSGFASNRILGADEKSIPKNVPNFENNHVFCLVKSGNFLRFATYSVLKHTPKDEESWMNSPTIKFPKEVDTLAPTKEEKSNTEKSELTPIPQAQEPTEKPIEKPSVEEVEEVEEAEEVVEVAEEKEAKEEIKLSPEEALELYIKSLQEFALKGTLQDAH